MKINWFSNAPWAATGYGTQTKLFPPRIQALGHDLSITAFYGLEGAIINWNGIQVYPRWAHPYGMDILSAHAKHSQSDIVLSLLDAWVFDAAQLKAQGVKWVPWFMVDCEPLQLSVYRQIKESFMPICCSQAAKAECDKADVETLYVPLGCDTTLYTPQDKMTSREALGLPKDKFIVGMVAANKDPFDRKAYHQQIEAFARFHRTKPDTMLYMHTQNPIAPGVGYAALNLKEFCDYHGLKEGDDYRFCDQYAYVVGFSEEHMARLYSSFDVLMNCSKGEGFGIPIVEAQACGTPVIVGDWTAMTELCFDGWKVFKNEADRTWNGQGAYMFVPRVAVIEDRLLRAYRQAGEAHPDARSGALAYDGDAITENFWKPALDAIQERLTGRDTELKLVKF
jgi:glycosyltransferase involved in cell wall biosynthesis